MHYVQKLKKPGFPTGLDSWFLWNLWKMYAMQPRMMPPSVSAQAWLTCMLGFLNDLSSACMPKVLVCCRWDFCQRSMVKIISVNGPQARPHEVLSPWMGSTCRWRCTMLALPACMLHYAALEKLEPHLSATRIRFTRFDRGPKKPFECDSLQQMQMPTFSSKGFGGSWANEAR